MKKNKREIEGSEKIRLLCVESVTKVSDIGRMPLEFVRRP